MTAATYDRHKEKARQRQLEISQEGRDIGTPPPPADLARKESCLADFRRFCLTYFAPTFPLPFSDDHGKVIAKIERAVLEGGLFAVAMPRGSGKTTLAECACLWALVYGHRSFVVLVGSDLGAAERMLESLKVELETNELLGEDFPEICYPIARLERIANRCKGQTSRGEPTYITWTADTLVLPSLPGSPAAGSVVKVAGLTGSIRGLKHKRPTGQAARPDLVIVDDPQTDESARSASQVAYRERVLAGAVLGLAGPGKKISGIMPCTVISPGDVADRILSPQLHPEWNGERTKLLYSLPARLDLWERYSEIRADSFRAGRGGADATEFYRQHRAEMDAGATPAWRERYRPDEVSAIQHAMNLRIDDVASFQSEYQNDPLPPDEEEAGELTADEIAGRVNRHKRGVAPAGSTRLTVGIDVQGSLLWWAAVAWGEDFAGAVVDYGAWPKQRKAYYTLRDASPTLQDGRPGTLESQLWAGLEGLAADLFGRDWQTDGGGTLRVDRALVDANWGLSTKLVYRWCRQSAHSAILTPAHGKGIGASGNPMSEWPRRPGERHGEGWVMPVPRPGEVRRIIWDANGWKSFLVSRWRAQGKGGLYLYGERPEAHRMFAEHQTAEYRVRTQGRGRELDEWKLRPHKPDNHLLDCLAMAAVAASVAGVVVTSGGGKAEAVKPKTVSWAEMQRKARESRGR